MFFLLIKIKGSNVEKRKEILCNYFYQPPDNLFQKTILTPHVMKTHFQKSNKEVKWKEGDVCKGCKWIQTTLLLMLRYHFL